MGAVLPKEVSPIVLERHGGKLFQVGFAEMNGWRKNMEDAHVIVMKDTWGFFGVFDGHGGDKCSEFVMQRLNKELENGPPPADDAAMKEVMLRIDREFLATNQPSGSTGTFALVKPPTSDGGQYELRVGNIGDSRVVLGRADGSIVEGPGTDFGITTDHKPDHPDERARIERTGGTVEFVQGVARVNGDLAVSRAFGDAPHKETGGPAQEDRPVTVDPEFTTVSCGATDFLMLVCDGISEGDFPNPEVVKLAAEELRKGGEKPDPAAASAAVCRKAIEMGSKDNLSCMIVLLGGGEPVGPKRALLSGPFSAPDNGAFRKAYDYMVKHAGLTLAQAVELRYDDIQTVLARPEDQGNAGSSAGIPITGEDSPGSLRHELLAFGDGPPSSLASGSEDRTKWFQNWLDGHNVKEDVDPNNMSRQELLDLVEKRPDLLHMAQAQGALPMRVVKVAPAEQLKAAMEAGGCSLRWTENHGQLAEQSGIVIFDDAADGTSRVKFPNHGVFAWLPTCALVEEDMESDGRVVKLGSLEQVKAAVEANSALKWFPRLETACGQCGYVMRDDDSDGTSKVKFPAPLGFVAWLPTSVLTEMEESSDDDAEEICGGQGWKAKESSEEATTSDSAEGSEPKKQRTA